jgi:hypothetical protein
VKESSTSGTTLPWLIPVVVVGAGIVLFGLAAVVFLLIRKNKRKKQETTQENTQTNYIDMTTVNGDTNYRSIMGASGHERYHKVLIFFLIDPLTGLYSIHLPPVAAVASSQGNKDYEIEYNDLIFEEQIGQGAYGVVWRGKVRNELRTIHDANETFCSVAKSGLCYQETPWKHRGQS